MPAEAFSVFRRHCFYLYNIAIDFQQKMYLCYAAFNVIIEPEQNSYMPGMRIDHRHPLSLETYQP